MESLAGFCHALGQPATVLLSSIELLKMPSTDPELQKQILDICYDAVIEIRSLLAEMKEKRELIRVVRTPEGEVALDATGKRSGRGAYVCRQADCLKRSIKQKQLERQLEITLTPAIIEALTAEMESLAAARSEAQ